MRKRGSKGRGRVDSRSLYATVDNVCRSCRREQERQRYHSLTPEQRHDYGVRANENTAKRKAKLLEQVGRARMIQERKDPEWDDFKVDIVPFRMWVLGQVRIYGGTQQFALRLGLDEGLVRRWANGYDWDVDSERSWGQCEPRPIFSVTVATVDKVGVAMDDPGLLERLYPFADPGY